MKFTVLWTPATQNHLAKIWMDAKDRQTIVASTRQIDLLLKSDPLDCEESRGGISRVAFASPLGFDFEVLPDDRTVFVLAV